MDTDKWSPKNLARGLGLGISLVHFASVKTVTANCIILGWREARYFINYSTGSGTRQCYTHLSIFSFFIPIVNLSPILIATMTFIARRSVPLNKAPVFIERKDISLSNYSARGVSAEERKKRREREKGSVVSQPYQTSLLRHNSTARMVRMVRAVIRVDHKRVHPAERCRYKRNERVATFTWGR
ncbi:hypothetical protein ACFW04_008478 [Cataglyphis niger]